MYNKKKLKIKTRGGIYLEKYINITPPHLDFFKLFQ